MKIWHVDVKGSNHTEKLFGLFCTDNLKMRRTFVVEKKLEIFENGWKVENCNQFFSHLCKSRMTSLESTVLPWILRECWDWNLFHYIINMETCNYLSNRKQCSFFILLWSGLLMCWFFFSIWCMLIYKVCLWFLLISTHLFLFSSL